MSDVFAELDEVMRQEKLAKFWRENGGAIIFFVVMTILTTAGISAYKAWDSKVRRTQTEALLAVMDDPAFPANLDLEALNLRGGLDAIGTLQAAGVYMKEGKPELAAPLYAKLAEDKSAPQQFRELGALMNAKLGAQDVQAGEELEKIYSALSAIAGNDKSPWRYHARIDMAVLLANKEQKFEEARQQLTPVIEAKNLPASLSSRAQALDHVYALKQGNVKDE